MSGEGFRRVNRLQLIDPHTLIGHALHLLCLGPIQVIPAKTIDRHQYEGIGQRRGDTEHEVAEDQETAH